MRSRTPADLAGRCPRCYLPTRLCLCPQVPRLDTRTEFGVWGGMTERERRALLRRRPDMTSWRDHLVVAGLAPDGDPVGV